MAPQTCSVVGVEYTILESVKALFFLPDDVDSFEQLIDHTQVVQNTLRDLKDKGWTFSANSGDWFEITAPSREAAVEYVGEEYVKNLEEQWKEEVYGE
jgi:hypothetical protein